jgi:hypothetical protein
VGVGVGVGVGAGAEVCLNSLRAAYTAPRSNSDFVLLPLIATIFSHMRLLNDLPQRASQVPPTTSAVTVTTAPSLTSRRTFDEVLGAVRMWMSSQRAVHLLVAAAAGPARAGRMMSAASTAVMNGSLDRRALCMAKRPSPGSGLGS